jgi:hypothetical protein
LLNFPKKHFGTVEQTRILVYPEVPLPWHRNFMDVFINHKNFVMADNRNQSWNQEDSRNQQPDQNQTPGTEQRTGSELGQQNRNQPETGNRQSEGTSEHNLGEQSERSSRDANTENV